jgi:purine nucleosidase
MGQVFETWTYRWIRMPRGPCWAFPCQSPSSPYDAARGTLITGTDLDTLALNGPPETWVTQTAHAWLTFWNDDVGLPGFYPFDGIAAAYLVRPDPFRCATVTARIKREWTFWLMPHECLVVEPHRGPRDMAEPDVQYCPETSRLLHGVLVAF